MIHYKQVEFVPAVSVIFSAPYNMLNAIKYVLWLGFTFLQIGNILVPVTVDPDNSWDKCKRNITTCGLSQLKIMEGNQFQQYPSFIFVALYIFCYTKSNFIENLLTYKQNLIHLYYTGLRNDMISALAPVSKSTTGGLFINSCYAHCQTTVQVLWHSPNSPRLNSKVRPPPHF